MPIHPHLSDLVSAGKLEQYARMQKAGYKIFYGPMVSSNDIAGIARDNNANTHLLNAQTISFFQVSVGGTGQGFSRPVRTCETTLEGAPGQLPGGYSYVAHSCGVYLPPSLPPDIKDHLCRHASLKHVRHSTVWEAGGIQFWPEASFGHQSQAVATTVANAMITFGVNGAVASRAFPEGGELFYPAKEVIRFDIEIFETAFVTMDGNTADGNDWPVGNQIPTRDGALVYVCLEGYKFEKLNA